MHPSDRPSAKYANSCGSIRRMIPLLVGGEVDSDLQASMESHLRECSPCGSELLSYRAQAEMLKSLKPDPLAGPDLDLWTGLSAKLRRRR